MPTKPFKYQLLGSKRIRKFKGRALLADEMGLGKSLQALYWCYKTKKARPIVVVCPASLKYNWEREARTHFGFGSTVLDGRKPWTKTPMSVNQVVIINYEILNDWNKALKLLKPGVVLLDECHYIKNTSAKRTQAVHELVDGIDHVIAISGTPLTNCPAELWSTLNIVRPDLYPVFRKFAWKYCGPKRRPWGWEFKGATNLTELHKKLRSQMMIRRLKKDVLKELPDKTRRLVPVRIPNLKQYYEAQTDFLKWLAKQNPAKVHKAKKAQSLVKIGYLKRLAAQLKMPIVFEWIDNFLQDSDGKLVVFTVHKEPMRMLCERYSKNSVHVDGSTKGDTRLRAVDQFNNTKKTRLFFGQVKAAGTGLNLVSASDMLIVEFPWAPADLIQAEDRIHRIGQSRGVFYHYLVAQQTIEQPLVDILHKKQAILDNVLEGKSKHDNSDNVFNALIGELIKK